MTQMKTRLSSRLLSLFMALILTLGLVGSAAFATANDSQAPSGDETADWTEQAFDPPEPSGQDDSAFVDSNDEETYVEDEVSSDAEPVSDEEPAPAEPTEPAEETVPAEENLAEDAEQTADDPAEPAEAPEEDAAEETDEAPDAAEETEELPVEYYCGLEEHVHTDECYRDYYILTCTNTEEGHEHGKDCYEVRTWLICGQEEHTHTEACLSEPEEEIPQYDYRPVYCGLEEHTHDADCIKLNSEQVYLPFLEEDASKDPEEYWQDVYVFDCGKTEHTHENACYIKPEPEPEEAEEEPESEPKAEAVVLDNLAEVAESAEEALLQMQELSAPTRTLLSRGPGLTAAPVDQSPVTVGGVTIEKLTVRWLSTSTGASAPAKFDRLEYRMDSDLMPNMQFQIDFALSGEGEHEAGSIELVFPASIFKTRDGAEMGELTLSVPEDPANGADFAWRRVGDNIVITNTHKLPAAANGMIQGTWRNNNMGDIVTGAHEMIDESVSDPFVAAISVSGSNGELATMNSNAIDAKLDTHVEAVAASKTAFNTAGQNYYLYRTKTDATRAGMPAEFVLAGEEDEYIYIKWFVTGQADGSQPFTMTLTDTAEDAYGAIMLGATTSRSGTVASSDDKTVTAAMFDGYNTEPKSAYIWTAYPADQFVQGQQYTLNNTVTIHVTGADDHVESTKEASAQVTLRAPTDYTIVKEWDDNNNADGNRPDSVKYFIYRTDTTFDSNQGRKLWKTVTVKESDGWKYSWSDEGYPYVYQVEELGMPSGTLGTYYDADGNEHLLRWAYRLKDTEFDEQTNTWTFINEYSTGWIVYYYNFDKNAAWKYSDGSLSSTRDSALNELMRGREVLIPFSVSGYETLAEWTGIHQDHLATMKVTMSDDRYLFLGYSDVTLTTDDVEVASVQLENPKIYQYTYYDSGLFSRTLVDLADTPPLEVYGWNGSTWILFATYNAADGTLTAAEGSGASVSRMTVSLPSGISQVKAEISTDEDAVSLQYWVNLRVKPSAKVLGMIDSEFGESDYARLRLYNEAHLTVQGAEDTEPVESHMAYSSAYLHGRQYRVGVYQTKEFKFVSSDSDSQLVKLHVESDVVEQSNVTLSRSEYSMAVENEIIPFVTEGTFYDLLPRGIQPDLSSIRLQSGDTVTQAYALENYKNSGRTLLVVKAKFAEHVSYTDRYTDRPYSGDATLPKEGYKNVQHISFDCYYPWSEAKSYCTKNQTTTLNGLRNTMAFESADEWIGNLPTWSGEADDASGANNKTTGAAVGTDKALMTDLDKNRDTPSFVYAGADLIGSEIDFAALTSLQKHVSVVGSGVWKSGHDNDVTVQEGGKYSYRLYVMSATDTTTKDIILLDSIEQYVPTASDTEDFGKPRWKGQFQSLDISQIVSMGVDPVVYYSTTPNLDISGYGAGGPVADKLTSPDWTTTLPADPSTVTAVAIDCRKAAGGADFELLESEALIAYINMRAPSGEDARQQHCFADVDYDDPLNNAHAFNIVYMDSNVSSGTGSGYINQGYTKVGIVSYDLHVKKVWDDNNDSDGLRPTSVTVHLYAGGQDTGRTPLTLTETNGWQGTFDHVKMLDDDGVPIEYEFVEDPVAGYTPSVSRSDDQITITNTHEPERTEVHVEKIWEDDELESGEHARPDSIQLRLLADGVFTGNMKTVRADESENWTADFTDLIKYRDHGTEIVYTVEEVPVTDFITTYEDGANGEKIVRNRYYPFGDLQVSKIVKNGTAAALENEFTFTLVLTYEDGSPVADQFTYTKGAETGLIGHGDSFTLKDGETILIKDIPTRIHYRITEDSQPGFTLTSRSNDAGVIASNAVKEASFTNTYASKGQTNLLANKVLTGRTLERYQFRFEVVDREGTVIRTATNQADGSVQFGALRYTNADDGKDFVYTIREVARTVPGYTFDDTVFTAVVTPRDNGNGTMTCGVRYFAPDTEGRQYGDAGYVETPVSPATFTNVYHAEGEVTLRAWKDLQGRPLVDDEFTVTLFDENGVPLQEKKNIADGSIVFDALPFNETHVGNTYHYFLREKTGDDPTVNYDESVYGYSVTVFDNGDGTLSFSTATSGVTAGAVTPCATCAGTDEHCPTCGGFGYILSTPAWPAEPDNKLPVFVNTLKDGAIAITKTVTSVGGAEPDPNQTFTFRVKLIGEELDDQEIAYELYPSVDDLPDLNPAAPPAPPEEP